MKLCHTFFLLLLTGIFSCYGVHVSIDNQSAGYISYTLTSATSSGGANAYEQNSSGSFAPDYNPTPTPVEVWSIDDSSFYGSGVVSPGQTIYFLFDYTMTVGGSGRIVASYVTGSEAPVIFNLTNSTSGGTTNPVYTNFTYCINNNLGVPALATWTYNGSVAKTETLAPGHSDCWTTPNIEVSPDSENFTAGTSLKPASVNPDNPFQIDTNGINFNLPPETSTNFVGSGTNGPSGGTNTTTVSRLPSSAPTNLVTFPTPTGAASESTLAAGFQLLHQDNVNLLNGEDILNTTVKNGFLTTTNDLGQIITLLTSNVLMDGTYFPLVYKALTNLSTGPTNAIALTVTNPPLNLTNYATETTLRAATDYLAQIVSNTAALAALTNSSSTNGESRMLALIPGTATNSDAATSAGTSLFSTPLSSMQSIIDAIGSGPDVGADPGHSGSWEMDFCGRHLDFDPADVFPSAVTFSQGLWKFMLTAAYLIFVGRLWLKVVQFFLTVQTGGVPNMDVFGGLQGFTFGALGGGNFIGVLVATFIPAAIILLWIIVVTVAVVPLGDLIGFYNAISGVFSAVGSTSSGAMAVHLTFTFFPVALAVRLLTAAIILQFTIAKAALVASAASRFLWGK